jgi:predicted phosphoribosyltransferase
MRAAAIAVRGAGAADVLVAAPVGAAGACRELAEVADLVVCPRRPDPFRAVGEHYRDFAQLDDDDVLALLR